MTISHVRRSHGNVPRFRRFSYCILHASGLTCEWITPHMWRGTWGASLNPALLWSCMCHVPRMNASCPTYECVTPVAGPIFGTLSTRPIEGFHFENCLNSRFYFVPNPSNLVSQVLLCARRFHTLNPGILFQRIQILLTSFWKRDREKVFYKCSYWGQMFCRYWKSCPTRLLGLGTK